MKCRIHWVDVAKCFGIFAIYLGHCGEAAGAAGHFVHTHHVALFFLLSGCMENFNREPGIWKTVQKVCRRILLPWLLFCALSFVFMISDNFGNWPYLYEQLWAILRGTIRGRYAAGGLWFLTCLAVIQLMFSVLRKLKHPLLIIAASVPFYYYIEMMRVPSPIVWPFWWYNLDSAFYYLLFYAIGYAVFPYADRVLNPRNRKEKTVLAASVVTALVYSVLVYLNRDPLQFMTGIKYCHLLHPIVRALLIIWLYFAAAKLLENVKLLRSIGTNTLYLCGGEYIVKSFSATQLSYLGINLYPHTLLASLLHSAGMLLLAMVTMVPAEKWLLAKIEKGIGKLSVKKAAQK